MIKKIKTIIMSFICITLMTNIVHANDLNKEEQNKLIHDYLFETQTDPYIGYKDAQNKFVVFFDYLCGYCRMFEETMDTYINNNNDAKFIKKHYPVLSQNSVYAAQAAISANKQGMFYEFDKELLKLKPKDININSINLIANKLGMDLEKFNKDMNSVNVLNEIAVNKKIGQDLNIKGTPTIISNNKNIYFGYKDVDSLRRIVNENK